MMQDSEICDLFTMNRIQYIAYTLKNEILTEAHTFLLRESMPKRWKVPNEYEQYIQKVCIITYLHC